MSSYPTYPDAGSLDPGIVQIRGFIATDASGVPTNASPPTATDQYGELLPWPKGIASVTHVTLGLYRVTLSQPDLALLGISVTPYTPRALSRATIIGTVDLTGLTLSTLNGLTLQTDADVGSNYTTTFTTPATIQGIADQINAGNTGTSVFADIVTTTAGAQHLRVVSTTLSVGSSLAIAAASTGDTTLGMSNTTATATTFLGAFDVAGYNPRGADIDYQPAATLDLIYQSAGAGADVVSGGFWIDLTLQNLQNRV